MSLNLFIMSMKIVILSFFSGKVERGVENWTYELSKRLIEKGHQVIVYQNSDHSFKANYDIRITNLNVIWSKVDTSGKFLRRLFFDYSSLLIAKFTLKAISDVWREKPDIIIPTNGGWQSAFIRIISWLRGSKMVIVGHSGIGWDDRNNLWSFPDLFVALSEKAKRWAKRANPLVKIINIPNGVDLATFHPADDSISHGLKKPVVLSVSALVPSKRVDLVIKAVAKLKNVSLLVVGKGSEEKQLRSLGKKLLGDRFTLKSFDYHEMPKVYRSADLFVSASESHSAFEMVILEAMASNLPVVVNDDGIRKEIIGDSGSLVDPTDIDAYSDALKKTLKKNWGNKPRKQAEKFDWEGIAEKYEEEFEELVGNKK